VPRNEEATMSQTLALILTGSLAAFVGVLVYWMITYRLTLVRTLSLLTLGATSIAVVAWLSPTQVATRASIDDTAAVIFCYFSMLLGMTAEYWYAQGELGAAKFKFEWTTFLMPIFASPIVFIPLLTITTDVAEAGGAFTRAKLMIYLVAFQNGFFWKSFFEQRRRELGYAIPATSRTEATERRALSA